jgi:hypothetical protein
MALVYEDHCCDCAVPGYPCRGSSCPNRRVEVHYCDVCGEQLDDIYEVDGDELCEECLKDKFRKER